MRKISCAGVVFINENNKVLLEDRRRIKKHGEHWSFFGGSIEEDETPEQTMKREIKEEMGFDMKDYKYFNKYVFVPKNNPDLEITYHMYIAKTPNIDELTIHSKGDKKEFTIKQALRLKITEKDREILKDVRNYTTQ